jgi:ribosome-binding factor A
MRRVNEAIREILGDAIATELKDPRIGFVTVTDVDTSPDLRAARVYVSVLGSEEETTEALRALRHAAGYLKRELGDRLRLRRVPNLDFRLDPSLARGARVMELLREIDQG